MGKKGFFYDQSLCSGCRACMMVCKENRHLPEGAFFRHVTSYIGGADGKMGAFHLSLACNHCEDPACVANCPTGAMYIDEEDGTVQHDDDVCIGCQNCVKNCPYGAPQYREDIQIVQKCDGCKDLRAAGEEPECVQACCMRALTFGEIDEGTGNLSQIPYAPASETNPATYVVESIYGQSDTVQEWIL